MPRAWARMSIGARISGFTRSPGERVSSLAAWRYSVLTPTAARSSIDCGVTGGGVPFDWNSGLKSKASTQVPRPLYTDTSRAGGGDTGRKAAEGGPTGARSIAGVVVGTDARRAAAAAVVGVAACGAAVAGGVAEVVVGATVVVVGAAVVTRRRRRHRQVQRRHLHAVAQRRDPGRRCAGPGGGADEDRRQQRLAEEAPEQEVHASLLAHHTGRSSGSTRPGRPAQYPPRRQGLAP